MDIQTTPLPDLLIFNPVVHKDARGVFFESFNDAKFRAATGRDINFVQDNQSRSFKHALRGLHYQIGEYAQAKFVRVVYGTIYDVCVDLRQSSPTFGKWFGIELSAENKKQLWIPEGFAHGFLTLSEESEVLYKVATSFAPDHQTCLKWDDPTVAIDWPLTADPILSDKDRAGYAWNDLVLFP